MLTLKKKEKILSSKSFTRWLPTRERRKRCQGREGRARRAQTLPLHLLYASSMSFVSCLCALCTQLCILCIQPLCLSCPVFASSVCTQGSSFVSPPSLRLGCKGHERCKGHKCMKCAKCVKAV